MFKRLLGLFPHECKYTEVKKVMTFDAITTISIVACNKCGHETVETEISIKKQGGNIL